MTTSVKLSAVLACAFAFSLHLVTPVYAASQTTCSDSHKADTMAGKASTNKSSHVAGGVGAGIDSSQYGVPVACDVDAWQDADNIVDTYLSGRVYEYSDGSYTKCIDRIPGWRGYWSSTNQTWSADLDTAQTYSCGWFTKPIKVRTIAQGQWNDGTILGATTFVTDTHL